MSSPTAYISRPMVVPAVFNPVECERLLGLAEGAGMRPARLDGAWEGNRVGDVAWLDRDDEDFRWIVERFQNLVQDVNRSYEFDLSDLCPRLQFTRYTGQGKFDWHHDCDPVDIATRKLTIVVELSEPDAYTGGNLEVFPYGSLAFSKSQGAALIFPAFLFHRVTPVESGTRNALVCWAEGPPFL